MFVLLIRKQTVTLTFNGQCTEVIVKPLKLNDLKFLPAVNGERLTPLNLEKLLTVKV